MTTQIRNAAMVSLLEPDFLRRNEPSPKLGDIISNYLALPGLRAFWPFSSVDENGDAYDLTGQGRVLTNTNTVTFNNTDFLPYAVFDGSTNYFTRADEGGLDITGDLTLGCWVRFDNAAGSAENLMSKWYNTGNQRSYFLARRTTGNIAIFLSITGAATNVTTDVGVSTSANTWYFVCARSVTNVDSSIFFNGTRVDGSSVSSIFNSSAPLEIGARESSTYLNGDIALPFLCAYAVPNNLITNLYQQSRVLFGV